MIFHASDLRILQQLMRRDGNKSSTKGLSATDFYSQCFIQLNLVAVTAISKVPSIIKYRPYTKDNGRYFIMDGTLSWTVIYNEW